MPRFDFKCPECGASKEDVILRIGDGVDKFPQCDNCHITLTKQPSAFNAHFKGAGFHSVDYHAPTRGY